MSFIWFIVAYLLAAYILIGKFFDWLTSRSRKFTVLLIPDKED